MLFSNHFRSTEARAADQQNHSAIADREILHQLLKLVWSENVFIAKSLLGGSHSADRIERQPFIADGMVVEHRQDAFQFRFRGWCQWKNMEPFLDLYGSNGAQPEMAPSRFDITLE